MLARGISAARAGKEAGYSDSWVKNHASKFVRKYAAYISQLKNAYAAEVGKMLAISQEVVLQEIARIAMYNDADYITHEEHDGKTIARFKTVEELSREQLAAVSVFKNQKTGRLEWKARDKEGKLSELGKHLGLFNEKIILEHRHRTSNMRADLSKVPMEHLEALEGEFEEIVTKHGNIKQIEAR